MWYVRRNAPLTDEQSRAAEALEGMGYASGSEEARAETGVLVHDPSRAQPGLNLWSSGHAPEAYLMDMAGEMKHRWRLEIRDAWPEADFDFAFTRKARLTRAGQLLMVFAGRGLVALDWDSEVLWCYDAPVHHDVIELDDGTIVTLDRRASVVPELHPTRVLLDDLIVFLDPATGRPLSTVSVLDALLSSEFADEARSQIAAGIEKGIATEAKVREANAERFRSEPGLASKLDLVGDIFHSNSITLIGPEFAANQGGFEAGWFLVSIRNLGALAAFELNETRTAGTVRWYQTGDWKMQHEAQALPSGRILLFDNEGFETKSGRTRSRVLEIDPATGKLARAITHVEDRRLLSPVAGACLRLDNGNTLVVESTGGTAYEVTEDGECVWKFVNPSRAGENGELIALLTHVIRMDPAPLAPWLKD